MNPRYLLDTHIVIRWLREPNKLSREQIRVLRNLVHRPEPVGVSAESLLEIAVVFGRGSTRSKFSAVDVLDAIAANSIFRIIPMTFEIAAEVAALGKYLPDTMDRAIVATARVERLTLITSDERIIDSKLVPVIV